MTTETGGRVFHLDDSEAELFQDLIAIDSDVRNGYWLVYRPAELRHDGSFHNVYVGPADPAEKINISVRAGYYAPKD